MDNVALRLLEGETGSQKVERDETSLAMIEVLERPQLPVGDEVRGGKRKFIGTRKTPGIVAWVASIPFNVGGGGGALHFMSV